MQHNFPGGPIPASLYEAMVGEYKQKRLNLIKENLGIDDATKVWFSKKTIDELFKAAGADEGNADEIGLEIHYGVVPQDRQGTDIPDNYVGLHNVILKATRADGRSVTDPYDSGTLCPPAC